MPELQRLRAEHAAAVLGFELAIRAYFAASITDRGDAFLANFSERHNAVLSEQQAGRGAYYVLVAQDGSILGRVNLRFVDDFAAELGYRIAQHTAGQGLATAAVCELCRLASSQGPSPREVDTRFDGLAAGCSVAVWWVFS